MCRWYDIIKKSPPDGRDIDIITEDGTRLSCCKFIRGYLHNQWGGSILDKINHWMFSVDAPRKEKEYTELANYCNTWGEEKVRTAFNCSTGTLKLWKRDSSKMRDINRLLVSIYIKNNINPDCHIKSSKNLNQFYELVISKNLFIIYLKKHNISMRELGYTINISPKTLYAWSNGKVKIRGCAELIVSALLSYQCRPDQLVIDGHKIFI